MGIKYFPYGIEKYQKGIESLRKQIDKDRPEYLCGLHRGGLIPATNLAYLLRIPLLTFDWRSCRSQETMLEYGNANILMVDEVIWNGWTVGVVSKLLVRKFPWAVLVYNPKLKMPRVMYHTAVDVERYNDVSFWWRNDI